MTTSCLYDHNPASWVMTTHDGEQVFDCDSCIAELLVALAKHPCLDDGVRSIDLIT